MREPIGVVGLITPQELAAQSDRVQRSPCSSRRAARWCSSPVRSRRISGIIFARNHAPRREFQRGYLIFVNGDGPTVGQYSAAPCRCGDDVVHRVHARRRPGCKGCGRTPSSELVRSWAASLRTVILAGCGSRRRGDSRDGGLFQQYRAIMRRHRRACSSRSGSMRGRWKLPEVVAANRYRRRSARCHTYDSRACSEPRTIRQDPAIDSSGH